MRALFFVPPPSFNRKNAPIDRVYGCNYGYDYKPPIHLLQLATWARERLGWEVRLVDSPAEGLDADGFAALAREGWDVAVSWTTYLSAEEDLQGARVLRAANPAIQVVYTGAGPTWKPEEFLLHDGDWVCLGEAEITLQELAEAWATQRPLDGPSMPIDGLARRTADGSIARGSFRKLLDVSTLPMPDRRLLLGRYRANRLDVHPITSLVVSRGCGFRCTFCTPNAVDQAIELEFKRTQTRYVDRPPLRKRTVEQIVAEFEEIAALGYKGVEIADNIFTWGNKRTREICARIAPLGLRWICLARANMLHDAPTLRAMKDAGCVMVYMGSESFDDGLLSDVQKELKVKDVVKAVETCRSVGLEPEVSILMGASPRETWGTLYRSWRAARRLGTRFVHYSVALPAPSTELYDIAIENGWFTEGDFFPTDNAREVIVNLPHLKAWELRLALKLAYAGQYLSPRGLYEQARAVSSWEDFTHKVKSGAKLLHFLSERDAGTNRPIPPGRITPPS